MFSSLSSLVFGGDANAAQSAPVPNEDSRRAQAIDLKSTEVTDEDLKWVLDPSYTTEGQTFYLTTDGGIFLFVQAVYSTMGWTPSVQLTCKIYMPDGKQKSKALSHAGTSFIVSDDKLSVKCEQLELTYLPATRGYHIVFKDGPECTLEFTFQPECPLWKANDGKFYFTPDPAGGYVSSQFMPRAKVTGSLLIDGVEFSAEGYGMYLHAVQNKPFCVGKWNFVDFQGPDAALMLYEFEMPATGYNFNIASLGSFFHNGKLVAVTTDNRAFHVMKQYDEFSGYEIPTEVKVEWNGHIQDNPTQEVHIEISMPLPTANLKLDVLSELPFLLRKVIQALVTAPFLYQWLLDATAKVRLGGKEFEVKGRMMLENVFLYNLAAN